MIDYTKSLPKHKERYIGENDLLLEIYDGEDYVGLTDRKPPLLFVHGAFTGSWMWSKYIPHFQTKGYTCYVMNLRSHYKSRIMDMTKITFDDYMEDIREVLAECKELPVLIGFSMGGILSQKIAEEGKISGLILIDTSISREVNRIAPYKDLVQSNSEIIMAAPLREEESSSDESIDDIEFQRKYLSMESSKAMGECGCWIKGNAGISVNSSLISCPCLIVSAISSEDDDRRGKATAEHLDAEYMGLWGTTHTGLLIGQRYGEVVERILEWLTEH